ncbi:DUF1307 domain-containing protein [Dubosiella newyorkensis]|jgi:uncharacterized lipoprotein YehR (DUF1307 family)|uniref:DUF1307 domain-containing protein n=1 Tax=Dubosiella newyorkensis TaxID=1862672 RepID=A0A1U7NP19_9FIRM|nr:DUF1307 domain-containing protein [Dubosiella newyorkensis]MCI9041637.1 YehR family protein [Dubosiella newyorkensis]OLU47219.1 hypothetical protein BO225_03640 [Dubosiella newyorkensis]
MKKGFLILCALCLCGCTRINKAPSAEKVEKKQEEELTQHTLECIKDSDSMSFVAVGDMLQQQTQVFYMTYEDLGINEGLNHDDLLKAINEKLAQSYGALQGVDVVSSLEDNRVKVTVSIDYNQANIQALIDAGLLHEGEVETKYVSLGKTQKQLEDDGFACTVQ